MSTSWKPKLAAATDVRSLTLTAVEGFVVSRIDGHTTPAELTQLTGQSAEQVEALLQRLASEGVLEAGPPPVVELPLEEPAADEEPPAGDDDHPTHLKRYRELFHALPADERAKLAATANGADLSALCFDPLPAVIRELLHNPHTGPEQARLIAAHHPNTTGLEFLFTRAELLRDAQVQRLLWRNPQLAEGQLRRLTQSKRLLQLWQLSISREAVTHTRTAVQRLLRARFPTATAEERVELIFKTEGRCLAGLSGLPIDGKTTSLLCARTYSSLMLVQNIAHWSAAPPALIAHLLKQQLVVRQARLRTMLTQHPNAPSHAKGH